MKSFFGRLFPALPDVGRMPYFWLAYLSIFFLLVPQWDLGTGLLVALISAAFLWLYLRSFRAQTTQGLWRHASLITALGVVATPVSSGAAVFFTYSACLGAGMPSLRQGWSLVAMNIAVALIYALLFHRDMGFWLPAIAFPLLSGVPAIYMGAFGRQQKQLLRKQEEAEHLAKIAERERIARDMHDVLGHTLTMMALKSELARKLVALAALLNMEDDLRVVAVCGNGRAALRAVENEAPDIVLTDIEMPEMSGLDLALALKEKKSAVRVVMLTTFARSGYLRRALEAGVKGYLLKDAPTETLAAAIRKVHAGGKVIAPELAVQSWQEADPLTTRERQVLRLAAEGKSTADIAQTIHLSEGTVRNYLSEAINKLGAANRVEAARIAREQGWL